MPNAIKITFQILAYLLMGLVPYLMITAENGTLKYLFYFPLFSVSMLLIHYLSGPLSAAGVAVFATIIGTLGFIFTLGDFHKITPVIFLIQIAWVWLMFWMTERLLEIRDVKIHRLQEEFEKWELIFSDFEQKRIVSEKSAIGLEERIARYSQLQFFTDQLTASLQVKEIQNLAESAIQKLFGNSEDIAAQVILFSDPNLVDEIDPVIDWMNKHPNPILVENLAEDARFSTYHVNRHHSVVACPMERDSMIAGVVKVESVVPNKWREEDLRFLSDITNIVSLSVTNAYYYEKIESLAVRDSLTSLFVRYRFNERIEEEFVRAKRSGSPLSLLLFDIDRFKKVNDQWGHPVGDLVLKAIAQIILNQTRETDFCARYGGEEIAVIMPLTQVRHAFQIAERIRENVASLTIGEEKIHVTISGGLSNVSAEMKVAQDLINWVDKALYTAKERGRNRIVKI